MAKQDDYIKTALRLPSDLHARIQVAAENAGRSMNAELIHRLEMSFDKGQALEITIHADKGLTMRELQEVLKEINHHVSPDQSISFNLVLNQAA